MHPGGRPLIFETAEELRLEVEKYIKDSLKPTLSGLAYHLGIDRQTLYNYKERPEFFDIIKKATDYVESKYEEKLIYDNSPTGVIFALKNMGWTDKQEIESKSTIKDERIDDSKLTEEELRLVIELQRKSRASQT